MCASKTYVLYTISPVSVDGFSPNLFVIGASWDKYELNRFWVKRLRSHCHGRGVRHSTLPSSRVRFLVLIRAVACCALREWWYVYEPDVNEVRLLALSDSDAQLMTALVNRLEICSLEHDICLIAAVNVTNNQIYSRNVGIAEYWWYCHYHWHLDVISQSINQSVTKALVAELLQG